MKTDFTISVNIGVTPELAGLVAYVLSSLGKKPERPTATNGQKEGETEIATWRGQNRNLAGSKSQLDKAKVEPRQEVPVEGVAARPETEPEKPVEEPKQPEQPEQPEQPKAAKEPTEEDVRAAMDRARQRIEGEDYKSNATGEGYVKYHRQLTATFKNIAATLGSEKPSALAADKRASFIAQCDELTAENGEIVTPPKF